MASRRALIKGLVIGIPAVAAGSATTARPAWADTPAASTATAAVETPVLTGNACSGGAASGYQALRDPLINRGLATSVVERELHNLDALLPSGQTVEAVEVARARVAVDRACTPLQKYQAINLLAETDQHACYALLRQNLQGFLPIVYTPTVGDACLSWGSLLPRPTGLYLSARRHVGRVRELLNTWPCRHVRIAVITDGERILGLGDLGAHGMGIPTGKTMVYGACGLDPSSVLPVLVDAGCNTSEVRDDPLYVGEREPRLRGDAYFSFMSEVVQGIQDTWGGRVLIHWEDVSSSNSFRLLDMLRNRASPVPTFNDDIECTAVVTLAAMLAAPRLMRVPLKDQTFLFFGAGQANLGCAELLWQCLQRQHGLSAAEARSRIWMFDRKGLLLSDRPNMSPEKQRFSQPAARLAALGGQQGAMGAMSLPAAGNNGNNSSNSSNRAATAEPGSASVPASLEEVVRLIRPTALIGAASVGGAFNQQVLSSMTKGVQAVHGPAARPLVMALSNPTSRAECTYAQAYEWTQGRALYASGTQFPGLVTAQGQARTPSQANNCYVFPGLGQGCVDSGAKRVTPTMLLAAAKAIAGMLDATELAEESLLPSLARLPEVRQVVASAVQAAALTEGVATA